MRRRISQYTEKNIKAISNKRKSAQEACFNAFELVYGSAVEAADASWAAMETALRATVSENTTA